MKRRCGQGKSAARVTEEARIPFGANDEARSRRGFPVSKVFWPKDKGRDGERILRNENHFSNRVATDQSFKRLGRLREWKRLVGEDFEFPFLDEL